MEYALRVLGREQCSRPSLDQESPVEPTALSIMESSLTCPRSDIVEALARILDEERVVHVRGTPTSGKTHLAVLLNNYNKQNGIKSVYIRRWPRRGEGKPIGVAYLVQAAHKAGFDFVTDNDICRVDITFIVDEAQTSYDDDELWIGPIKFVNGPHRVGPRFCLFISYGSPSQGPESSPSPGSTYSNVGVQQRVSITISHLEDSPQISLFFTREEFDDVLRRKRDDRHRPVAVTSTAADYLFDLTNGHPGAVEGMLGMLYKISFKENVLTLLDDEAKSFRYLRQQSIQRSFPDGSKLTSSTATVLREVLQNGSIPRDLEDEGIRECSKQGWLHSEMLDDETGEVICVFPTRLHAKYVEHYLTRTKVPFPLLQFSSIEKLAEEVLRKFSPRNLSTEIRLGTGAIIRPVESRYQDEFYRALHEVLGFSSHIHSEWSGDGDGRIDFRVTDVDWGIEILRDGDRLAEHCARFINNGIYTGWIQKGWLKQWLIIDCRSSNPHPYEVPNTKLWRAVFADDFSSIEVLDALNNVVVPRFALKN